MAPGSRPAVRLSRGKRICFSALTLCLTLTAIELICRCTVIYLEHESQIEMREAQTSLASGGGLIGNATESIHPYLGWVLNPQVHPGSDLIGRHVPVNSLGFNDREHGIPKRNANKFIVGVTGGSVAWQSSVAGENTLIERLRQEPLFRNREIQLIRLAMSGYKQPQQLMSLNYLLALGAEFDVVVNIDGYNEMALAVCENEASGVFEAYPRMWQARVQDVVDPRIYSLSFRLLQIRADRQRLASNLLKSPLRWSAAMNLLWYFRNQSLKQQFIDMGVEIRTHKHSQGFGFTAVGPSQLTPGDAGAYDDAAALWRNCSRQMHRLCRGNGIAYVHVLQPNQYVPDSKPMNVTEREAAIYDGQTYGKAVVEGYPLLIRQGAILRGEGIAFHDLTRLFSQIDEQIYVDLFCHYNQRGNDLLAEAVAEKIIDALKPLRP